MAATVAAEIYAEQLVRLGYGHPLWQPEPDATRGEILVGDVGFVTEGCFIRMFNAMRPSEDPVNQAGVPDGFTPLKIGSHLFKSQEQFLPKGPLCTTSVKTTSATVGPAASG